MKTTFPLASVLVLIALAASLGFAQGAMEEPAEFEDATLYVVYSSSDEDAQIFVAGGADDPLRLVEVFAPSGKKVLRWKSKDGDELGHADFQFETPEPSLEGLMEAYPAGPYRFVGMTVEDETLVGEVELSYDLLPAPYIVYPQDGDTSVPANGLVLFWDAVPGAEAIRFELEDEEEEVALKVDLPGDADSFEFPNNWLQPGTEYVFDIKAIGENGNQTVTDVRFTTED